MTHRMRKNKDVYFRIVHIKCPAIGKWTNYRKVSNYIPAEHAKYKTTMQNFATQINSLSVANFIFTKVHT